MEQHSTFDDVYAQTHEDILRFIVIRTNRSGDVEDIFQEVYRSFYVRLTRRDAACIRKPKQYLYAIARKELARFYKRRQQKTEAEAPLPDTLEAEEPPPDEQVFTRDTMRRVWTLVQAEPLASYKAFVLYYGFSMSVSAIAVALGISEAAVKQRLLRTRNRIRAACKEETHD